MWPDPAELFLHSSKVLYLDELAKAAENGTHTEFPAVFIITSRSQEIGPHMVVKRGYSDGGNHVITKLKADPGSAFREAWDDTQRQYRDLKVNGVNIIPPFFAVPYLDALQSHGEIRVIFVGGEIIHMTATDPDVPGNDSRDEPMMSYHPIYYVIPLEMYR